MLAIKLPEEIENRLAELAAKTGRTKTYGNGLNLQFVALLTA